MIETIALLRLAPYFMIAALAIYKRYKWLALFSFYLMAVALYNFAFEPSTEVRAVLSSVSAFLLLLHALDIGIRRS